MTKLRRVITNTITKNKIVQAVPLDIEVPVFDESILITETDHQGIITYANRRFFHLSGFSKEELIGSPHSITRHPDMPVGVFKAMWKIILAKKVWRSYVKSLRKDGKYYWTLTYIQAKLDEEGNIIGFTASRKMAYPESRRETEEKYSQLQGLKHIDDPYFMRSELYHGEQIAKQQNEANTL